MNIEMPEGVARNAALDALEYGLFPALKVPSDKECTTKYWELLRAPDCPSVDVAVVRYTAWLKEQWK